MNLVLSLRMFTGFRWNSLLDLETADYRFEDFEEFAEDYVDTSDLLKQFGK